MSPDVVILALLAGAANYAFRVGPILLRLGERTPSGPLARFLAATGPAAIATLATASLLPLLWPVPQNLPPLAAGTATVLAAFAVTRSPVAATLGGALACGLAFAAFPPA